MRSMLHRWSQDTTGGLSAMLAVALIPILFLIGMTVEYGIAAGERAQLQDVADAAALAAVAEPMMGQSDAAAAAAAKNTFSTQAAKLSGTTYEAKNLSVAVQTNASGARTATVSYSVSDPTLFSTLLGKTSSSVPANFNISVSSTATAGQPPNIDFYLLLDDSPSMALAATPAGIETLINHTQYEVDPETGSLGCAFGCHESNPAGDGLPKDNYSVARAQGITLRIDLVNEAAQNLMTTAAQAQEASNARYRMGVYTFDYAFNTLQTLTSDLGAAQHAASNIQVLEVCQNNERVCGIWDNDMDTDFDNAMYNINQMMPNPGSGTDIQGDRPQEVLLLVTDGVEDSCEPNPFNAYSGGGCRQQWYMDAVNYDASSPNPINGNGTDWCTTVKNRGIRIAVLYTTYVPMLSPPLTNYTAGWYKDFYGAGNGIASFINNSTDEAATALQACASPGLFHEVETGGDISAALSDLFTLAVQTAYLAK